MEWRRKTAAGPFPIEEQEKRGIPLLRFPLIEQTGMVIHGFTTREGGVSTGDCASMNLSFTRGDDPVAVHRNYERAADALGVRVEDMVCSDQTHTTNVRRMTAEDRGKGIIRQRDYADVDGMITDEPGLVLTAFFADCVPLYFVDPVHRAVGLAHSGWKGTAGKIGACTVEAMTRAFGSRPEDIVAAVGPSICKDCYEVGREVIREFAKIFDAETMRKIAEEKPDGKYQLDLWKANEKILLEAGICREHLTVTDICTCCNPKRLFSHRASHGRRGNLAAFLAVKPVAISGCI